jgi:hypothetical protein
LLHLISKLVQVMSQPANLLRQLLEDRPVVLGVPLRVGLATELIRILADSFGHRVHPDFVQPIGGLGQMIGRLDQQTAAVSEVAGRTMFLGAVLIRVFHLVNPALHVPRFALDILGFVMPSFAAKVLNFLPQFVDPPMHFVERWWALTGRAPLRIMPGFVDLSLDLVDLLLQPLGFVMSSVAA